MLIVPVLHLSWSYCLFKMIFYSALYLFYWSFLSQLIFFSEKFSQIRPFFSYMGRCICYKFSCTWTWRVSGKVLSSNSQVEKLVPSAKLHMYWVAEAAWRKWTSSHRKWVKLWCQLGKGLKVDQMTLEVSLLWFWGHLVNRPCHSGPPAMPSD